MTRLLIATSLAFAVLAAAVAAGVAQTKVRTETIRAPSAAPGGVPKGEAGAAAKKKSSPAQARAATEAPEIITDLSRLPPPVARMRARILAAARSGDLNQVVTVMQSNEVMPIFSLNDDKDPVAFWLANYPDSGGLEVLSILAEILETPFVHTDAGTPQEMYLWPYFARMPLKSLTPEQRVELFRIVTGSDYKEMLDFGAYNFYRAGIGPDGTWHFFVSGD